MLTKIRKVGTYLVAKSWSNVSQAHNSFGSIRKFSDDSKILLSSYIRSANVKSIIQINFKDRIADIEFFRAYVNCIFSSFQPLTTKATLHTTAVAILLFLPLIVVTFSSRFLEAVRNHSKAIPLPAFLWRLLDKFCLKVVRPIVSGVPGLEGVVRLDLDNKFKLGEFILQTLTVDFVSELVVNTPLSGIIRTRLKYPKTVATITEDQESEVVREFDPDFLKALTYAANRFNCSLYSIEFLNELDSFFMSFPSHFRTTGSMLMVQRHVLNSETETFGIHKIRDTQQDDVFIAQGTYESSFTTESSHLLLISFLKLLKPHYYVVQDGQDVAIGKGSPITGDVRIDLTDLQYIQIFKSLFSVDLVKITKSSNVGKGIAFTDDPQGEKIGETYGNNEDITSRGKKYREKYLGNRDDKSANRKGQKRTYHSFVPRSERIYFNAQGRLDSDDTKETFRWTIPMILSIRRVFQAF